MTEPLRPLALVALGGVLAGLAFAETVRPPHLFPYSDAVFAGVLTLGLVLAGVLAFPDRWLHSDAVRLAHAFKVRHRTSDTMAAQALKSITGAHDRAARIRTVLPGFRDDLADRAGAMADQLDGVARVIFYSPETLPLFRAALTRSELVIEALEAHAKLRGLRGESPEVARSRAALFDALQSLDDALVEVDTGRAAHLLARVETLSDTAETLLGHRRRAASTDVTAERISR
jgi:hypothetical protein